MMSEFTSQGLANTSSLVKGEPFGWGEQEYINMFVEQKNKKKVSISKHLQKCDGHVHLYSFDYLAIFEAC